MEPFSTALRRPSARVVIPAEAMILRKCLAGVLGPVLALGLLLALAAVPQVAQAGQVALTFDDLPGLTLSDDPAYETGFNAAVLSILQRRRAPATGFVIGSELGELTDPARVAIVQRWLDAGFGIGNHTFSHEKPSVLGAQSYVADIGKADAVIRPLLTARGLQPLWFRHPALSTGPTPAAKAHIDDWLSAHGYRIAPVTIDASDWEFAEPYDAALARGDRAGARRIRESYLAYTAQRIAWARRASRALFGRQIAQVMLLHDTRLNADCLDQVLNLLARAHLKPVSLDAALRDPAYRTPDLYVGADGPDWFSRWSVALHKPTPDGDNDPPAYIQAAYDRVDNDRK